MVAGVDAKMTGCLDRGHRSRAGGGRHLVSPAASPLCSMVVVLDPSASLPDRVGADIVYLAAVSSHACDEWVGVLRAAAESGEQRDLVNDLGRYQKSRMSARRLSTLSSTSANAAARNFDKLQVGGPTSCATCRNRGHHVGGSLSLCVRSFVSVGPPVTPPPLGDRWR